MVKYNGMIGRIVFVIGDSEDSECFESGNPQEVGECQKLYQRKKSFIEDREEDDWFAIYFVEDDVDADSELVGSERKLPVAVRKELKEIRGF